MVEAYRSHNQLLAALPIEEFDLLRPFLSTVEMVQESVLVAAGDRLMHVYFPHSGVISLVVSLTDGQMVEVAMIGHDSLFGGSAALDGQISLTDAVVLLPGTASILDLDRLRMASEESAAFRHLLARHEQALFAQAQQTRVHGVWVPRSRGRPRVDAALRSKSSAHRGRCRH